ncbi:MAG: hypothetical protein VXW87_04630 [Pseudomonadota bacterium]|nr:hypothetical protein [Pseudomonadota bacterium]
MGGWPFGQKSINPNKQYKNPGGSVPTASIPAFTPGFVGWYPSRIANPGVRETMDATSNIFDLDPRAMINPVYEMPHVGASLVKQDNPAYGSPPPAMKDNSAYGLSNYNSKGSPRDAKPIAPNLNDTYFEIDPGQQNPQYDSAEAVRSMQQQRQNHTGQYPTDYRDKEYFIRENSGYDSTGTYDYTLVSSSGKKLTTAKEAAESKQAEQNNEPPIYTWMNKESPTGPKI